MFLLQTPGAVHGTAELDGKATDGKDRASSKKAKGASGNHGMIIGKTGDGGKTASGSGNDVGTQRWFKIYWMPELLLYLFCYNCSRVGDSLLLDIYIMMFMLLL